MITQTELALAYNRSADESIKQAISKGFLGTVVRIWCTSNDQHVCSPCAELDDVEVGMEGGFNFYANLFSGQNEQPPLHPRCGCCLDYREIEPPVLSFQSDILHMPE